MDDSNSQGLGAGSEGVAPSPPANVAMNPVAEEEDVVRRGSGLIVQDNPIASKGEEEESGS